MPFGIEDHVVIFDIGEETEPRNRRSVFDYAIARPPHSFEFPTFSLGRGQCARSTSQPSLNFLTSTCGLQSNIALHPPPCQSFTFSLSKSFLSGDKCNNHQWAPKILDPSSISRTQRFDFQLDQNRPTSHQPLFPCHQKSFLFVSIVLVFCYFLTLAMIPLEKCLHRLAL